VEIGAVRMSTEIAARGRGAEWLGLAMTSETRQEIAKWVTRLGALSAPFAFIYFRKAGVPNGNALWLSGAVFMALSAMGLLIQLTKARISALSWGAWLFAALCFGILGWLYP
jgi:hypothetical protein